MSRKPSRAAVRVLTILAYIEGTIIIVKQNHADPIILDRVEYARKCSSRAMMGWEIIGQGPELRDEMQRTILEIQVKLNDIWWLNAQPEMNYPGMCYIGMQLLTDLMELISDPAKSLWLEDIYDAMTVLIDHVDPEGVMFLTQERATEAVNAVYSVIGER